MRTRFYNAKILVSRPEGGHRFSVVEGELWVCGDTIRYIGEGAAGPRGACANAAGVPSRHEVPERPGDSGVPETDARPDAARTSGEPFSWDREIDAGGNLLIPGFKNAHTHTAMTFLRSYADDLPLADWLSTQVFPREAQLTAEDIYWLDILGIMEYLTSGITANGSCIDSTTWLNTSSCAVPLSP